MKLTTEQFEQLQDALLSGYGEENLRIMVRLKLGEKLATITTGGNLSVRVFDLIEWAEQSGRIFDLIDGAHANLPDNAGIKRVWEASQVWRKLAAVSALPTAKPLIEFDWVTIPAGRFLMGSDIAKDKMALPNETPQLPRALPKYRIARVPVTVEQFGAFVKAEGYRTEAEQRGAARIDTGRGWEDVKGVCWAHPSGPDSDVRQKGDHPVTFISWRDALKFCQWARVRLPNEAEWEKAARGDDGLIYPWGNEWLDGCCNVKGKDTTPVDRYSNCASPYRVLDMAGNVWEWTCSLPKDYPYKLGEDYDNDPKNELRVLRGGTWADSDYKVRVRCAYREMRKRDHGLGFLGFRVATS